jgi:hypothetical protein
VTLVVPIATDCGPSRESQYYCVLGVFVVLTAAQHVSHTGSISMLPTVFLQMSGHVGCHDNPPKNIYNLIILSVTSIRLQCFSRRDHASSRLTGILRGIRDTAGHVVDRSLAVVDFGAVLSDRYNTNMGIKVLCGRMRTSYFRWDLRKTTRQKYKLPGHRDVLRVSRTSTTVGVQYVGRHTDARRTRFS